MKRRAALAALALCAWPAAARAQAWTPPAGIGAASLGGQYVWNTDHRLSDGNAAPSPNRGRSVSATIFAEVDYGLTDRFATGFSVAYVFVRYTDPETPTFPLLPVDACRCWNSTFQDFTFAARYRIGNDPWAVTPLVRLVVPSHPYDTRGEAVVGRNLRELQVGVAGAYRFVETVPDATIQAGYTYAFVPRFEDVPLDRSSAFVELGYSVTRQLFVHADLRWQRTHGGLRAGYLSGDPFPPPGEVAGHTEEHDRLLRDDSGHLAGGVSYSFGAFDAFVAYDKFVRGTDTHDNYAVTAGLTYYFGR